MNTSHLSTEDYTLDTPEETIFSGNSSCVLSPEVTEGPYYVAGEYIRTDVTDEQEGVALHLELQVLDIDTCEPVTGAYTEIWREYTPLVQAWGESDIEDIMKLTITFPPHRLQLDRCLRWRVCPGQRQLCHGYLQPRRHFPPWCSGDG